MKVKARSVATSKSTRRPLAALVLLLGLCTLLSLVGGAQAAKVAVSSFGGAGTLGGQFGLSSPGGVAVNANGVGTGAVAGDLYIVDSGNHRIQQFHADGEFVRAFGLNVGGAGVNVCTVAASCQAGTASNVAGAMSAPKGVAVDQATGNVFVTDQGSGTGAQATRRVDVFGADGSFQGAFGWGVDTGAAAFQFCTAAPANNCQAPNTTLNANGEAGKFGPIIGYPAVDDSGRVYVANPQNRRVDVFTPTLSGTTVTGVAFLHAYGKDVSVAAGEGFEVCTGVDCRQGKTGEGLGEFGFGSPIDVAADSAGDVYALDSANRRVQKFNATPAPLASAFGGGALQPVFGSGQLERIAVDRSNDHVFVAGKRSESESRAAIQELLPSGAGVATHGKDLTLASEFAPVAGGVAATSQGLYLGASIDQRVYALAEPTPPAAVTGPSGAGFAAHLRTLEGSVNPEGFKLSDCYFEYGLTTAYGSSTPCLPSASELGEGTSSVDVTAETGPLEPNAIYHYRIVVENFGDQTAAGTDGTFTAGPAPADDCPNAERRAEQGIGAILLPDCMALEMVSPPQKGGQGASMPAISADSERVLFTSSAALGGTPGVVEIVGDVYVASRGASGWTTASTVPLAFRTPEAFNNSFDPSFSRWLQIVSTSSQYQAGIFQVFREGLGGLRTPLSPLLAPPSGTDDQGVVNKSGREGASADLSHVYFKPGDSEAGAKKVSLLAGDPEMSGSGADHNVYVARIGSNGAPSIELLARDQDGKAWGGSCGSRLGGFGPLAGGLPARNGNRNQGAVSVDGSRVYLSVRPDQPQSGSCDDENKLRILERLETDKGPWIGELFTSECSRPALPEPPGSCQAIDGDDLYQGASTDGTKVYFTTNRQLADGDLDGTDAECSVDAAVSGCDLYLYDSTLEAGHRLIQVSAGGAGDPTPGEGASVYNGITAISGDGSHVYFVAEGVLTTDENPAGEEAQPGQPNLYLYERDAQYPDGHTAFLGTLDLGDGGPFIVGLWGGEGTLRNAAYPVPVLGKDAEGNEVGGDGHILLFRSKAALTGDDTDSGRYDTFRYDAGAIPPTLERVSKAGPGGSDNGPVDVEERGAGGAGGLNFAEENRWVSEDGDTVLITTAEGLLAGDVNGSNDFYLWRDGELHRLPGRPLVGFSGDSAKPVLSHDGSEVAFQTVSPLLPSDGDSVPDIYVARVEGGYPNPAEPEPCDPFEDGSCQGPGAAGPLPLNPTSAAFSGGGNAKPKVIRCPKGKRKARHRGRVRCVSKRKNQEKATKKHRNRNANPDRRAGK